MRIVIVIGQLGIGGGERQLYLLLKGLNREKYSPTVVSFNPGRGDYWEESIQELKVPILFVAHSRFKLKRLVTLFLLLKKEKPHLLISWTLHLNFVVGIIGKWVGITHIGGSIRNDLFNRAKKSRRLQRFFGTKGVDWFVANSTKGKADLVDKLGIETSRVKVIFNAVSISVGNATMQKPEILESLGLPLHTMSLVSIGRMEQSKNPEMLLRVLRRVLDRVANVVLVYIGEGPQVEMLKVMAEEFEMSSSVFFLGKLPMAVQYLGAFDIFCHVSVADGMPNVVLEGSSAGLPVVSTYVNGADDIIVDGVTGYLVEPNDVGRFSDKVLELLIDPMKRNQFGAAGRQRALSEQFSEKTMVRQFEQLFDTLTK